MKRPIVIALALLSVVAVATVLAVGLSAMSRKPLESVPSTPAESSGGRWQPQVGDGGGVQVAVVPLEGSELAFQVSLSTHSVELGEYDLARLSRVTLDSGPAITDATWTPEGPSGGHHVSGTLAFPKAKPLSEATKRIELEIADVANVKIREFQWTVDDR